MRHDEAVGRGQEDADGRWTVGDAIDFELAADRVDDDADRIARSARSARSAPAEGVADRRTVFRAWLAAVRARPDGALPGLAYERGLRLVRTFAAVAGLVLGAGLAGSLLAHAPGEPINALLFFAGTAGLQVAVLLVAAAAWAMRRRATGFGPLRDAALLAVGLAARATRRLDGERRDDVRAHWAATSMRSTRLAPLVGRQLLGVTQRFAVAFNIGLLAAMLLVWLPFEELRFGWQSTYSFTTAGVDAWVRIVAAPWSWIPAALTPDAAQIAATQYTRGQRAETLPADAARAWWPFLVCAIVFYGLLLRVLLAVGVGMALRRHLAGLRFDDPAANALWRRLDGPLVASSGGDETLVDGPQAAPARHGSGTGLLVVDEELAASADAVRGRVESLFGGAVRRTLAAEVDDDALPGDLAAALAGDGGSVVVAVAATRDPIVAVADFVRALVARTGGASDVTLLLVADPVADERVVIWKRFVAIQRLRVGVERST